MTIPFGRRRLVLSLVAAPHPAVPEAPSALGATDAELARLANPEADVERARWEAMRLFYGGHRP